MCPNLSIIDGAILPQTATKLTKTCSSEFGSLLWRHLMPNTKLQYRCTMTIPVVHKCLKDVLENLLPV